VTVICFVFHTITCVMLFRDGADFLSITRILLHTVLLLCVCLAFAGFVLNVF
jgi:hypothetical protein